MKKILAGSLSPWILASLIFSHLISPAQASLETLEMVGRARYQDSVTLDEVFTAAEAFQETRSRYKKELGQNPEFKNLLQTAQNLALQKGSGTLLVCVETHLMFFVSSTQGHCSDLVQKHVYRFEMQGMGLGAGASANLTLGFFMRNRNGSQIVDEINQGKWGGAELSATLALGGVVRILSSNAGNFGAGPSEFFFVGPAVGVGVNASMVMAQFKEIAQF